MSQLGRLGLWGLALLALCLGACSDRSGGGGPVVGSETHFLTLCVADGEGCPGELACVCGICTTTCDQDRQCGDLAEGASCDPLRDVVEVDACESGSVPNAARAGVCHLDCSADSDCGALEGDAMCRDGQCVTGLSPWLGASPDASVPRDAKTETDAGSDTAVDVDVDAAADGGMSSADAGPASMVDPGCSDSDPGLPRCSCEPGFDLVDGACENIDECALASNPCEAGGDTAAQCDDTDGSYTCTCGTGFTEDSGGCRDVDECAPTHHPCASAGDGASTCSNTTGSYTCTCSDGYVGSADAGTCTLLPGDLQPGSFVTGAVPVEGTDQVHALHVTDGPTGVEIVITGLEGGCSGIGWDAEIYLEDGIAPFALAYGDGNGPCGDTAYFMLEPGDYSVRVAGFAPGDWGDYGVRVTQLWPFPSTESEPNDSVAEADAWAGSWSGRIESDDVDMIRVDVAEAGSILRVHTDDMWSDDCEDLVLWSEVSVLDDVGALRAHQDPIAAREQCHTTLTDPLEVGSYYVVVSAFDKAISAFNYALEIDVIAPANLVQEVEDNGSVANAQGPLQNGDVFVGTLDNSGSLDIDALAFSLPDMGFEHEVRLTTSWGNTDCSETDTWAWLADSSLGQLYSNDDDPEHGLCSHVVADMPAGDYHTVVRPAPPVGDASGPYVAFFEARPSTPHVSASSRPYTDIGWLFSDEESSLEITEACTIAAANVRVDAYAYPVNLDLTLIAPGGTEIILRTGGGSTDPGFTGIYPYVDAPSESLDALIGLPGIGTWTLRTQIQLNYSPPAPDQWLGRLGYLEHFRVDLYCQ